MPASSNRGALLKHKLSVMRQQFESLEQEFQQNLGGTGASDAPDAAAEFGLLRDGLQQILRTTSASTALNLLLTFAARQGRRAILFILRKNDLWAWSGLGPGGEKLALNRLMLTPADSPALFGALQRQQLHRVSSPEGWTDRLGGTPEGGGAAIPLPGGERSAGILWFEAGEPGRPGAIEAVECLVAATGAALELISQRRPGAVTAGGRLTADERVIAGQLPYATEDAPASTSLTQALPSGAGGATATGGAPGGADLGRQHEDARRLARLLVSEIKLYNEDRVVMGRKSRDLYQRLREDIERSRQVYSERVAPEIMAAADYFQQELVAILAGGDTALLGPVPATA